MLHTAFRGSLYYVAASLDLVCHLILVRQFPVGMPLAGNCHRRQQKLSAVF